MNLRKMCVKFSQIWDPRPTLAKKWLDSAQKYEERLRANCLNPEIVESVLQEKNRICVLFERLLPEFKTQISVVVTQDSYVEYCSVSSWNNHIYIFVSASLNRSPIRSPGREGIKSLGMVGSS